MDLKIFLTLFFISINCFAIDSVHVRPPDTSKDKRLLYTNEIIKEALEITKSEYGPTKTIQTPAMNNARALDFLTGNVFKNFVLKLSYGPELDNKPIIPILFPIDLGIVGKRVCFVTKNKKEEFSKIRTLNELKKFTIVQGNLWQDTAILKNSGLKVIETPKHDSLFHLVAKGRMDLFCRGANELWQEYIDNKDQIPDLTYDEAILITYDMPRFLYVHEDNKVLKERLEKGIIELYKSGKLYFIWDKYYKESVMALKLKDRKSIYLDNPFLKNLKFNYKKYYLNDFNNQ